MVFLEQANKREKTKTEKLFTWESSQQAKRRTRKSLWVFLLDTTTNYTRKKNQKEIGNIFVFSQSFSNTQEEGKKNKSKYGWYNEKVWTPTNEISEHECNVGGKHVLPLA